MHYKIKIHTLHFITLFIGSKNVDKGNLFYFAGDVRLFSLPPEILRNRFICESHFDETDFKTTKKFFLKDTAVPKKYTSNRNSNTNNNSDTDEDLEDSKDDIFSSNFDSSPENHSGEDSECSSPIAHFTDGTLDLPDAIRKIQHLTETKYKHLEKIERLKQRNIELKRKSMHLEAIKAPVVQVFVKMQIRHKNRPWSKQEKEFAISLYHRSAAAYLFMQKQGFILPSTATIREWLNYVNFRSDFDESMEKVDDQS